MPSAFSLNPQPVGTDASAPRADSVDLIAVVGGESTGKSTLAAALARELPGLLVPETLRTWVAEHGRVPRPDEQQEVMLAHAASENRALRGISAASSAREQMRWVVSDGGTLMTAVYSVLYYDDDSLLPEAVALTSRARLVVWCGADIPWTADEGQRDGPDMRKRAQQIIGEVLSTSGLPWLAASGDVESRVAAVVESLGDRSGLS